MSSTSLAVEDNIEDTYLATFNVSGAWQGQCRTEIKTRHFNFAVSEPAELGGDDSAANPMEYLLAGLEGCLAVVIETVAKQYQAKVNTVNLSTEATLDVRGFLGNKDIQPYFQKINTRIDIDIDLGDTQFANFTQEVAVRCPAGTLFNAASGVDFNIDWVHI